MELNDRETILKVIKTNSQLRRLYREHVNLEDRLTGLQRRNFLTPTEEMEIKSLKKKKLYGVDRMMAIISQQAAF